MHLDAKTLAYLICCVIGQFIFYALTCGLIWIIEDLWEHFTSD
jgi:hypothetical protein